MKRTLVWALGMCLAGTMSAQTMRIHTGAVTVAVPAARAGEMVYGDGGTTLTVMGKTYRIADIDSITADRSVVTPASVEVRYDGAKAQVQVTGDVAARLAVAVKGADVSVVAAPELQEEVFYTLKGTSADGSFFMDGEFKSTVTLENLSLTNTDGAAIDIANGKRIDILLPEGTTTRLSDGAGPHKACLFVNGHPEFGGGGTLLLTGNAKHAFASDEYTRFKRSFGTLKVLKAVSDGLHINQYFKMEGGCVEVAGTGGDCVDVSFTKHPEDSLNGQAIIEKGLLRMEVSSPDTKGLKVDSIGQLTLSGGTIEANVTGNGCKGISVGGNLLVQQKTETPTRIKMLVSGTTYMPGDPVLEAKCRGIRGKADFVFDGGSIEIDVTGVKAKAVKLDGNYWYKSGQINCPVDAAN